MLNVVYAKFHFVVNVGFLCYNDCHYADGEMLSVVVPGVRIKLKDPYIVRSSKASQLVKSPGAKFS
jgi:hypothetical protein